MITWFDTNSFLEIGNYSKDATYRKSLDSVTPLKELVTKYIPTVEEDEIYFLHGDGIMGIGFK